MRKETARSVAVIDIGKTNAKLAIVDIAQRAEIAIRTVPNLVLRSGPYPHYDTDALWDFILEALSALNREHPIDAITVTTHGAACALLEEGGNLALPVLDYEHEGPDTMAAGYDAIRPPFAETGTPRLPRGLNLGAQLYWLQHSFPDHFASAATILIYPQYWAFRLTGVAANEITSLGCHTDLWNLSAHDYSALVDRLDWRKRFAPLRKAMDCLGMIRPEIAIRTGLPQETPIYCGIHDSNASLLPHLMGRSPPFSVVSTGTWVVAMAIGGDQVSLDPKRDTLMNVNALGDPVPSARFMGGREHALLTADLEGNASADDVAAVLSKKILLMPSVQGGSGPFPNSEAKWLRDAGISSGERCAAISLYLAMMTSVCLDLIEADGVTIAEGPFARNDLYLRMLAAATGRDVLPVLSESSGTSIGAALLASNAVSALSGEDRVIFSHDGRWTDYAQEWLVQANSGC